MLGALLGVRWSTGALLKACLSIALLGGLLIVASTGNIPLSFLGFVLLGLGLGPTFPTALAVITAAFPGASGSATSLAMAVGFVGGMVIPWLLGVIMEAQGPRVGALLLPLGTLIMLGCLAAANYFHRPPKQGIKRNEL
jgi:fucose permease